MPTFVGFLSVTTDRDREQLSFKVHKSHPDRLRSVGDIRISGDLQNNRLATVGGDTVRSFYCEKKTDRPASNTCVNLNHMQSTCCVSSWAVTIPLIAVVKP